MLHLVIPVLDGHDITQTCLSNLANTVVDPESIIVHIFDNASDPPYSLEEIKRFYPYSLSLTKFNTNKVGYYAALAAIQTYVPTTPADLIALMHNDVWIYEVGFDRKLREAFVKDGRLGAVGFCGSNELDDRGGRGGGTMMNFVGIKGQKAENTGRVIEDLQPAILYDSLFMCFRQAAIADLGPIDEHIPLGHFTDKCWPMRLTLKGWHCAVLGVAIDHLGGMTSVGNGRWEQECYAWCLREGVPVEEGQGGITLYLESERRFLEEMRFKNLLPSRLNGWSLVRG